MSFPIKTWETRHGLEHRFARLERDPFQFVIGCNDNDSDGNAGVVYSLLDLFDGKLDSELRALFGDAAISEAKALARQFVLSNAPTGKPPWTWRKTDPRWPRWLVEFEIDSTGVSGGEGDPTGCMIGGKLCSLREFVDESGSARAYVRQHLGDADVAKMTACAWSLLLDAK